MTNHTDTNRSGDLVERLRALHVWPQAVADDHADLLTPRQIDKLYEVGRVSHEAADRIEQLEREKAVVSDLWSQQTLLALDYLADCNKAADRIEALEAEVERLREKLAAAYIKLSGKSIHTSDCATSSAPAMKPGPCDCAALGEK